MLFEDTGFLCMDSKDEFSEAASWIYSRLGDEMSRVMFANRLLFSLTNDPRYMRPVITAVSGWDSLYRQLTDKTFDICIYGAGRRGKRLVDMFPEVNWRALVDRAPAAQDYHGCPIIPLDGLRMTKTMKIVVSVLNGYEEIETELIQKGADPNQILVLSHYDREFSKDAYFDKTVLDLKFDPNKFFVDAGCYDGKDTIRYINCLNEPDRKKAKVTAFEPDFENYVCCKENMKGYAEVTVRNTALYSDNMVIHMTGAGEQSKVAADAEFQVRGEKLDDVLGAEAVGFIKMDIEGSEMEALKGAVQIISKQHPLLAISVYHKKSDIWKIPKFILECFPDYQLFLRHYNTSFGETILYAVP